MYDRILKAFSAGNDSPTMSSHLMFLDQLTRVSDDEAIQELVSKFKKAFVGISTDKQTQTCSESVDAETSVISVVGGNTDLHEVIEQLRAQLTAK